MSEPERLAALLHETYAGQMWCEPDWSECDWRDRFMEDAARLIAAGVSVPTTPAPPDRAVRVLYEVLEDALHAVAGGFPVDGAGGALDRLTHRKAASQASPW